MRISMVIPYYGALPKWLPLFVQSAARNERVHFFIATDEIFQPRCHRTSATSRSHLQR
jgi:hypothetical protein